MVVLLAGRWEVVDREYQGTWTNILSPAYAAYVKQQLEQASQLVTATGAHMVFLTAPCTDEGEQPDGAPWPEDNPARLAVYNKLVREVAAEHPQTDSVVDLNAAACPGGKFTSTVDGVVIRHTDGVHFTTAGGELAGAQAHAAHRGRRHGRRRRPAGRLGPQPAGDAGFGFTFCGVVPDPGALRVDVRVGCRRRRTAPGAEGMRWPSSTMAPSEMVVIERVPRAVGGVGLGGQRERGPQLLVGLLLELGHRRRWGAGDGGAQVVLDGAVHVDAGLLGQGLAALVAAGAQAHHGAADGERRCQDPTSTAAAVPPHVRRASARPTRAGSG